MEQAESGELDRGMNTLDLVGLVKDFILREMSLF